VPRPPTINSKRFIMKVGIIGGGGIVGAFRIA